MKHLALVAFSCAAGVAACSHPREPTDVQLATLLRTADARVDDPAARLDHAAVQCLQAWSGTPDLMIGLPPDANSENSRKACRARLDEWLGDASRNPAKFSFDEIDAPAVVQRAMALAAARASLPGGAPPVAMTRQTPPPPAAANRQELNLGSAGVALKEAEDLCTQANRLAAAQPGSRVAQFADFCRTRLAGTRAGIERLTQEGRAPAQIESLATEARRLSDVARKAIASAQKQ